MLRLLCTLLLIAGLTGCGQSGPLYLPGDPSQIRTVPPAPADDAEEREDQEDNGDGSAQ